MADTLVNLAEMYKEWQNLSEAEARMDQVVAVYEKDSAGNREILRPRKAVAKKESQAVLKWR